ncbi:hypothetical protein BDC45DRAFT_527947 [Circinella umbellata]|nr:hypothetical protein BDC45DRAFT_527947 [Circinella umbellata]
MNFFFYHLIGYSYKQVVWSSGSILLEFVSLLVIQVLVIRFFFLALRTHILLYYKTQVYSLFITRVVFFSFICSIVVLFLLSPKVLPTIFPTTTASCFYTPDFLSQNRRLLATLTTKTIFVDSFWFYDSIYCSKAFSDG